MYFFQPIFELGVGGGHAINDHECQPNKILREKCYNPTKKGIINEKIVDTDYFSYIDS